MSLLHLICKELGIEIGEIWRGSDGFFYQIRRDGLIETFDTEGNSLSVGAIYWEDILTELVKPKLIWKPRSGEQYFSPFIRSEFEARRYFVDVWENSVHDNFLFENNLVFKTKEEAISHANKLLKASQKEGQNES